jgi:hypothetical protein
MRQDVTLENELCLLLLRRDLAAVRKRTQELLASPLQWQVVLEKAYQYEIAPLLYRQLETLGFPRVPETIRTELENFVAVNAIRNDLLAKELARLLRLLVDAKIPVMPLKSTVLAETLYEDPAFRVCTDIDLLVPTNDVIAAHNLILSLGYHSQITQPFFLNLLARYGKDCELMREDQLCIYLLELHCGLVWGGRLERDLLRSIWADAIRKSFYGVPAFALSPDWEFLYLATHAAKHGRLSLKWFVDLDRFCSRSRLDWASIKQKAQQLGWEDAVRDSLSACAYLLGTPSIPPLRQPRISAGLAHWTPQPWKCQEECFSCSGCSRRQLKSFAISPFVSWFQPRRMASFSRCHPRSLSSITACGLFGSPLKLHGGVFKPE